MGSLRCDAMVMLCSTVFQYNASFSFLDIIVPDPLSMVNVPLARIKSASSMDDKVHPADEQHKASSSPLPNTNTIL